MMALYEKVRDGIASLSDTDTVYLENIFVEPFSPPPGLQNEIVPMAVSAARSSDQGTSQSNIDDKPQFPAERLINLFIFHIWEQKLHLSVRTWRDVIAFYEKANFSDRCVWQIPLEALFIMSKADANEIYARKSNSITRLFTRDQLFDEDIIGNFICAFSAQGSLDVVKVAESSLSTKIKNFLKQGSIISAFNYCLNDVIFGSTEMETQPPVKKRKCDPEEEKMDVEKPWILANIDAMEIYVAKHFAPLKGVTLTDGILINIGAVVEQSQSEARHHADLFGLACHEAAHFLTRAFVRNYNFSTPTKDRNGERTVFRMDKEIQGNGLEMGRFIETELFGGIQPNWSRARTEKSASIFLERAAARLTCPPALIDATEHAQLGLVPRPCSFSFAGELIADELFLE